MLFAYVREQRDAVDFLLEKDGNWNMIGVNNGTALHRAAWSGDLAMVKRLAAKGADVSDRNNPFTATPFSWADHNKQTDVCQWMRAHCAIDLHDAVSFDLREHAEARLREDPESVDKRIDHWRIPQGTPLHSAAALNREEMAKLLLEKGADPNILAGNGLHGARSGRTGARGGCCQADRATWRQAGGGSMSADMAGPIRYSEQPAREIVRGQSERSRRFGGFARNLCERPRRFVIFQGPERGDLRVRHQMARATRRVCFAW